MNTIQTSVQNGIATITLNRPKSNALDTELLNELADMLHNIEQDDNIGAAIITGQENFFSAGLDLMMLYQLDAVEVKNFWQLFLDFIAKIIQFKKPLIAAVNGHSPAGGCVIALACDVRVMAEGNYIIGLNEVPVGIVVPHSIFELYSFWLGKANAYRYLLEGKLFTPDEALKIGLVDEICTPKQLLMTAQRMAKKYLSFEQQTWQQSKINLRKSLIATAGADQSKELEGMLKQWWAPGTRSILQSLVDKLQKK